LPLVVPDHTIQIPGAVPGQNYWPADTGSGNPNSDATLGAPFTFASGTLVLQQVGIESIIDAAWIRIDVPFDDPAAAIAFGTSTDPTAVLGPSDVTLTKIGQYINQAIVEFYVADILSLVIFAGASTQGSGLLVYRYNRFGFG
jgi:hypothetical protein